MDDNPYSGGAGRFANSRRSTVADDTDFILAQRIKGVPASAVARMLNRNLADVLLIYGADMKECEREEAEPEPPRPAPAPRPSRAKVGVRRPRSEASPLTRTLPTWAKPVVLEVANKHGFTVDCLCANDDKRVFIAARREAWHTLYATGRCSLPQIGAWFGGRNHASIHSGIKIHAAALGARQPDIDAWNRLGATNSREEAA
jgi:hypothetical protein